MTDPRIAAHEALWQSIKREQEESIPVDIRGKDHFVKQSTGEDTFRWTAGPKIVEFHNSNGVSVLSLSCSDEPDITTFFFPSDRQDLADLFRLTFR